MEENDQQPPRLLPVFGPGMQIWMLIALYISFMGILLVLSRSGSMAWLNIDENAGFPVDYARWAAAFQTFVMFGLPAIIYANVFPMERFRWFRLNKKVSPLAVGFCILALLSFSFFGDWLQELGYRMISDPETVKELKDGAATGHWVLTMPGVHDLLLMLFVSAFIPALFEEMFFRGCLQQLFGQWLHTAPQAGIWFTAILFSLAHFDPTLLVPIFIAGVMLGYAFYWTGSLRINIAMHFSFNALTIVLSYLSQHSPAFASFELGRGWYVVTAVLAFIFFGLLKRFSPAR